VSIKVANGDPVGAHHCVLTARCPALATRLRKQDAGGLTAAVACWELDDFMGHRASTVRAFLEYLYCDYCRAAPDVAASLEPLADEFALPHLAAGVSAATQTESCGSGVRWVRTASGWSQIATDDVDAPGAAVSSTYVQDLLRLVLVEGADAEHSAAFVRLFVKQVDGTHSRLVHVARPLLLASSFFRALLDGGFAEAHELRHGTGNIEVSADNADALVLCLQMLATGDARPLMPTTCEEALGVMVEAHRLGFQDAVNSAELVLSRLVKDGELGNEALESIAHAAYLYDLERLANEARR